MPWTPRREARRIASAWQIGHRLRLARESCHLDRVHAAHLLGVAPITIKKWESGEKTPNLQGMWACSEVYDVECEWFLMPEDEWKRRQAMSAGTSASDPRA